MLIDIVNMETLMTAREAAAELGVSPATLYAYVSRGMIRSVPQVGSRQKLYAADDVRALRGRAGAHAPAFGETAQVIETAMMQGNGQTQQADQTPDMHIGIVQHAAKIPFLDGLAVEAHQIG